MNRYLIEETGFPKNRETLKAFQEQFTKPIDALLKLLPGNRVLSGFDITDNGDGTMTSTEGLVVYNNEIYTVAAYNGPTQTQISLFKTTEDLTFNTGTPEAPVLEDRPGFVKTIATVGNVGGATNVVNISTLNRDRKIMEYLLSGTTFIGVPGTRTGYTTYTVNFFNDLPTDDYFVLGRLTPTGANELQEQVFFITKDYTESDFKVDIDNSQIGFSLFFEWTLIAKNVFNQFIQP